MDKNYILHKYLNGEATAAEIEVLENDPEFKSYLEISKASSGFKTPAFDRESNFSKIESGMKSGGKIRKLNPLKSVLRIAAVIAIAMIGYFYVSNLDTTVKTQIAQKESFSLPDASEVTLNASSKITYNKKNWNENRSLDLDGEAYFKVEKGSTFSVNTSQGVVKVLGTQFNVFSRDNSFQIKCFEGLVSVLYDDTLVKIPAGTILKVENNKLLKQYPTAALAPSWISHESTFENAPMKMVLDELQRQYSINLTSHNTIVDKHFSGSFTHDDLQVALKSICDPLQLEFTINGEEVTIYADKNQ